MPVAIADDFIMLVLDVFAAAVVEVVAALDVVVAVASLADVVLL